MIRSCASAAQFGGELLRAGTAQVHPFVLHHGDDLGVNPVAGGGSCRQRAIGIDVDRAMLEVAAGRGVRGQRRRPQFIEGRIEQLPLRDGTVDAVVAVTVLCLVADRRAAVHEAARVLRPGGRMVIGDLGRWNAWAAKRRLKGWFGSKLWRAAHFTTADELCEVVENAGLTVKSIRGSVFYPPSGILARWMAPIDMWLGSRTSVGAAFIAIAARK